MNVCVWLGGWQICSEKLLEWSSRRRIQNLYLPFTRTQANYWLSFSGEARSLETWSSNWFQTSENTLVSQFPVPARSWSSTSAFKHDTSVLLQTGCIGVSKWGHVIYLLSSGCWMTPLFSWTYHPAPLSFMWKLCFWKALWDTHSPNKHEPIFPWFTVLLTFNNLWLFTVRLHRTSRGGGVEWRW